MLNRTLFPARFKSLAAVNMGNLIIWSGDALIPGNKELRAKIDCLKKMKIHNPLTENLTKYLFGQRIVILELSAEEGTEFCLAITTSDEKTKISLKRFIYQKKKTIAYQVEPDDFKICVVSNRELHLEACRVTNITRCSAELLKNLTIA